MAQQWHLPWQHVWKAVAAQNRFSPFRDPMTLQIHEQFGSNMTDVLYRCECGLVKTKAIKGTWKLEEVARG